MIRKEAYRWRPGRKANVVQCEGCAGTGWFLAPDTDGVSPIKTECPLCLGTGFEPTDIRTRKEVEGRNYE